VPRGFVFNGASGAPNIELEASAIHDWLYLTQTIDHVPIDRLDADKIYRDHLERKGWSLADNVYFWGVRVGGWRAWNRYRAMRERGQNPLLNRLLTQPDKWYIPDWNVRNAVLNKPLDFGERKGASDGG
jgi:hypothetical protein